jgi:hypothetical protein
MARNSLSFDASFRQQQQVLSEANSYSNEVDASSGSYIAFAKAGKDNFTEHKGN